MELTLNTRRKCVLREADVLWKLTLGLYALIAHAGTAKEVAPHLSKRSRNLCTSVSLSWSFVCSAAHPTALSPQQPLTHSARCKVSDGLSV